MSENIARAALWFALLLLLTSGCATRGPVITERNLPPEGPQATPAPSPETDAPTAEDDAALAALLNRESRKSPDKNGAHAEKPAKPDPSAAPAAIQESPVTDAPTREIESRPDTRAAPPVRQALPHQGPLGGADPTLLGQALAEPGGPRSRAALALTREGRQLLSEGNFFLAQKRFEKALSVDASNGQAMLGLAEVHYAQEQWQQAATMATKAALHLGKQPYFLSRAHLIAARAFINGERPDAAYQQAQKAVAADPENEEARLLRISLEAHLGISP